MLIGYARTSTVDQHIDTQEQILRDAGCEKFFSDQISGIRSNRPGLSKMLDFIRDGDVVMVTALDRLGRSTQDLLFILDQIKKKGAEFKSLREQLDTTTPQGKFMQTVFAAMSELEREMIRQRQRDGIEAAKGRGAYTGRVPIQVNEQRFQEEVELWLSGKQTAVEAQKHLGLSRSTFYRRCRAYGITPPSCRQEPV